MQKIEPSKELSTSYNRLNYHYHLKKIEVSKILDESNSLFFEYWYNTIESLVNICLNNDFL